MGICKSCQPYVDQVTQMDFVKDGINFAKEKYNEVKELPVVKDVISGINEAINIPSMDGLTTETNRAGKQKKKEEAPEMDDLDIQGPKIDLGNQMDDLDIQGPKIDLGNQMDEDEERRDLPEEEETKPKGNEPGKLRAGRKRMVSTETKNGVTTVTETIIDEYGNKKTTTKTTSGGGYYGGNKGKSNPYLDDEDTGYVPKKKTAKNPYLDDEDDTAYVPKKKTANAAKNPYLDEEEDTGYVPKKKTTKNPYLDEEEDDGGYVPKKKTTNAAKNPYLDDEDDGGYVPKKKTAKNPYLDDEEDTGYVPKKKTTTNNRYSNNDGNGFSIPIQMTSNKKSEEVTGGSDFVNAAIKQHNKHRALHNACALKENPEVTAIAQKYAEYLASNNLFQHSGNKYKGDNLGENIYFGTYISPEGMTDAWYNEIKDYDFRDPGGNFSATGHFTQVVWKGSKYAGFGVAKGRSGYIGVGNYYPAGNWQGEYEDNVDPPNA